MYPTSLVALLATSAAAQSTVTVLNYILADSTLTLKGSDAAATTYINECPSGAGLSSAEIIPSSIQISNAPFETSLGGDKDASSIALEASTLNLSPITGLPTPAPTPKARLRRQDDDDDESFCEPYTLIQGPSTWEFHLTDPVPGAWTVDSNCSWTGEFTSADITCTATNNGTGLGTPGVSSTVFQRSELSEMEAIRTVAVVSATGSSVPVTPSGSPSGSASGGSQSTGQAPAGPLPTGAMIFMGGAAGLFAAALV